MINKESFILSSLEISYLTQTAHNYVLKRACESLISANINPNNYWHDNFDSDVEEVKKILHLPKHECLIAISNEYYSDKARANVIDAFDVWERGFD